ncbi:MAG: hypothetical protein RLZZ127_1889 [Planctomycetota bacterium]|jgi:hypothetical protein
MLSRWVRRALLALGVLTALGAIAAWNLLGIINLFLPMELAGPAATLERVAGTLPAEPACVVATVPAATVADQAREHGPAFWPFALGLVGPGSGAEGRALGVRWQGLLGATAAWSLSGRVPAPGPDFHTLPARILDQEVDLRIRLDWLRIESAGPLRQRLRLGGVVQAGDGLGIPVEEAAGSLTWAMVAVPGGWRPVPSVNVRTLKAGVPAAAALRSALESRLQKALDRHTRRLVLPDPAPTAIHADLTIGTPPDREQRR